MRLPFVLTGMLIVSGACAPHRAPVVFDLKRGSEPSVASTASSSDADLTYTAVPTAAAAILGCSAASSSPVCNVAAPTAEEDSAFRAEGVRLTYHADARCRKLGTAIIAN